MADVGCTDEKHSTYSKTIVPQLHWEPVIQKGQKQERNWDKAINEQTFFYPTVRTFPIILGKNPNSS